MKKKHTVTINDYKIEHVMVEPLGEMPQELEGIVNEFQRRMTEAIHDAFHVPPTFLSLDVSTSTNVTDAWLADLIPKKKSEPKSEFKSWPYAQD